MPYDVHGEIKRKYDLLGGGKGFLGAPLTNETGTPDGVGRYNHFEHGSIYWTPRTGPMCVSGSIRDKWASLGWETGFLGYPVTDEIQWRTFDPSVDQFISWNLFENGAIVRTLQSTDVAVTAHLSSEQLRAIVWKTVDRIVHGPDLGGYYLGMHPDVYITKIWGWEYDFRRSRSRKLTFRLHAFRDNGLLGDTDAYFWFTTRLGLSQDPIAFIDDWFRGLQFEVIPNSVDVDVQGISGALGDVIGLDDFLKIVISNFIGGTRDIGSFPVTSSTDAHDPLPHNQARLVVIDAVTTRDGGIDFLISPEAKPLLHDIQGRVDQFVADFLRDPPAHPGG